MAFAPNHSANLPREFGYCPHCLKKGVYKYGGTVVTAADGTLDGWPPGRRCKYCGKPHPENMTREAYQAQINENWLDRQLSAARLAVGAWSEEKRAALKAQIK